MIDHEILAGAERQAELEAAKAAFFMSGGQVQQCGLSETHPRRPLSWNTAMTQRAGARREFMQKERDLAGLIRAHAVMDTAHGPVTRTAIQLRNKLRTLGEKLTTPQVEQIAAKYQVQLAYAGRRV